VTSAISIIAGVVVVVVVVVGGGGSSSSSSSSYKTFSLPYSFIVTTNVAIQTTVCCSKMLLLGPEVKKHCLVTNGN
jgi:hypothetical protein